MFPGSQEVECVGLLFSALRWLLTCRFVRRYVRWRSRGRSRHGQPQLGPLLLAEPFLPVGSGVSAVRVVVVRVGPGIPRAAEVLARCVAHIGLPVADLPFALSRSFADSVGVDSVVVDPGGADLTTEFVSSRSGRPGGRNCPGTPRWGRSGCAYSRSHFLPTCSSYDLLVVMDGVSFCPLSTAGMGQGPPV
jgi:hypothetical protein